MGSATLAAERAASRERSAERSAVQIHQTRARMLLDLARPGASRAELQESAASQWPKLGGREQDRLVEEAERLQALRRGISVAPDLTRLALTAPERAIPAAMVEVSAEAEVATTAPAAPKPTKPTERKKPAPAAPRAAPAVQETSPTAQPSAAPAAAPAKGSTPSVQIEYGPDGMRVHAALDVRTRDTGAVAALLDVIQRLTVEPCP